MNYIIDLNKWFNKQIYNSKNKIIDTKYTKYTKHIKHTKMNFISSTKVNKWNTIKNDTDEIIPHKRPSWDEYFSQIVSVTASRSPCERLKVGCLIVRDNRIISQGYNGFLPGCPHESIIIDGHEQGTLHAEQNAIIDCAKRGVSCDNSIMYITHFPCIICMRLICASGINEVKYIHDYNNDNMSYRFSKLARVPIYKIETNKTK